MLQLCSTVTFFPILTEHARPWGNAHAVLIVVLSPIDEKKPILTGLSSALIVTLYQTVAHLLTITSPTIQFKNNYYINLYNKIVLKAALGAIQALST